jgi:hypothetical protein
MVDNSIRHLKGIFVPEDITDECISIAQSRCLTLQHYTYDCHRSRNEHGIPYGNTVASVLRFTLRVSQPDECDFLYRHLMQNREVTYSFIFNATFDEHQRLTLYDDAIAIKGFVVDVAEAFQSKTEEQMQLTVEVLLNRITYVGKDSNKPLVIV